MLRPQDRQLFLDHLRPPAADDGQCYRLDLAVGTTYSLDLFALLSAPVAMAFTDWQDQQGRPAADPLALLKAVREYADRICIFCEAGKIYIPKAYQPLLVNLEGSIAQAIAPRGGSFHPKVWVLRFARPENPAEVIYRVLILTRNLTFDRSWDLLVSLEGPLRARTKAIGRNHPLGEFVESLGAMSPAALPQLWIDRLGQISYEVRRTDFEVPEPFEDVKFVPLGIEGHHNWFLRDDLSQLLTVAPFIDDDCARDLCDICPATQIVSRPESLALVSAETLSQCRSVWTLDDTAEPDAGEQEGAATNAATESDLQSIPLTGLHAKLYVGDYGWQSSVWAGSANATRSAFERNVEFLVELSGKRSKCGVDAVLGKRAEAGPRRAGCFADLLQPYKDHVPASEERLAEIEFERLVDRLSRELTLAGLAAHCERLVDSETYRLTLRAEKTPPRLPAGVRLRCWPTSLHDSQALAMLATTQPWPSFEPVSFEAVTSFFAFEVVSSDDLHRRRFVINLPLVDPPPNRRERVLRNLLDSPQKLLRFLLMLLSDQGAPKWDSEVVPGSSQETDKSRFEFLESTLLESLIRALDRDPMRIDHVGRVISDLLQTDDGRSLLPDNFEAVWEPIWAVRKQQLEFQRQSTIAATAPPESAVPEESPHE